MHAHAPPASTPTPAESSSAPPAPPVAPAAAPSLAVDLAGLSLANPMMTASGTCGYADEYADFVDLSQLGAFVTKSISLEPRRGNDAARIVETRAGMLNAIGLANVGLEAFLDQKLPVLTRMRAAGPRVIVNVVGHAVEDFVTVAGRVAAQDAVDAIELNVSCPNVKDGLFFGTQPDLLKSLVSEVRQAMDTATARPEAPQPLIVKLSPNVTDITATAAAAIEGGAKILSMVNTFNGMTIDIHTRRPRLARGSGGLSGPAVRPMAIYQISRVYREVARDAGVPIIGMGGIQYWQDAAEFLLAGATGLAVGTALFVDPATPVTIMAGLQKYLNDQGCSSIQDIIGQMAPPIMAP